MSDPTGGAVQNGEPTRAAPSEETIREALAGGEETGFDVAGLRARLLGEPREEPDDGDQIEDWERYAEAIEATHVPDLVIERGPDGHVRGRHADGRPLEDDYLEAARFLSRTGPATIRQIEELRRLVEAAAMAANAEQGKVTELILAAVRKLEVEDCGHKPEDGLHDLCEHCALRKAMRRFRPAGP